MQLVPEDALRAVEPEFEADLPRLSAGYGPELLDDPVTGRSLRYYLILSGMHEHPAFSAFSPEQMFWSRYYWFVRFAQVWQGLNGYDAGLEQQAHQITEYPHPDCEPDWAPGETVDAAARQDAAAQLQALSR